MRPAASVASLVLVLTAASAGAQVKTFPYKAVVATEGTPVYGGPGQGYYATGRLSRGDAVVVHRHDPGGWSMIAPPADGFSLVKAEHVKPAGAGAVEVTAEEASVRVGSRVDPQAREVEQVRLVRGDRLEVAASVAAPAGWIAVRPPRGEYRWIAGRYAVAADGAARVQQDADPFAVPSVAKRPEEAPPTLVTAAAPPTASQPSKVPAADLPTADADRGDTFRRLRDLDRQLDALDGVEPTEWPLDALAVEYRRLGRAAQGGYGRQIELRLAQVERLRVVQSHYADYIWLASGTDQRDAVLLARQEGLLPGGPVQTAFSASRLTPVPMAPVPAGGPTPGGPGPGFGPPAPQLAAREIEGRSIAPTLDPFADAGRPDPTPVAAAAGPMPSTAGVPGPQPPVVGPPVVGQPRRFDAVGVVQRAVDPHPEAPRYVLTAPNGTILFYLQDQPGVPLEKFVGQPMGIDGATHRHPDVKTPMIVVDRLTPVRF